MTGEFPPERRWSEMISQPDRTQQVQTQKGWDSLQPEGVRF